MEYAKWSSIGRNVVKVLSSRNRNFIESDSRGESGIDRWSGLLSAGDLRSGAASLDLKFHNRAAHQFNRMHFLAVEARADTYAYLSQSFQITCMYLYSRAGFN